jgi:hypothetical protein
MQSQITLLKNQWKLHEKKQGTLVYPSQKQIADKIYKELTTTAYVLLYVRLLNGAKQAFLYI